MKILFFSVKKIFLVIFLVTMFSACLNNVEEPFEENPIEDFCKTRSFSTHVKTIIDTNCIQCHGQGGNFPNLTTFEGISKNANFIKAEVESRRMPKVGSLTDEEIKSIICWVDEGALNN